MDKTQGNRGTIHQFDSTYFTLDKRDAHLTWQHVHVKPLIGENR